MTRSLFLEGKNVWRERVELYSWTPRRCHVKDRKPPIAVVGVKNRDAVTGVYYPIAELDQKTGVYEKIRVAEKLGLKLCMLLETEKGYHVYFSPGFCNPQKVVKFMRASGFDKKHLSLYKTREGRTLVLRVSPKTPKKTDIVPELIKEENFMEWHYEVYEILSKFQRWKQ